MTLAALLWEYKYIIAFYLLLALFFFWKRQKVERQAKIILLYRTKWGLQWMEKYAQKFREWIILLGYIGVGAGYVGLVFISYILIKNLYELVTHPAATSGVSLVLPGINVPGLGILPFWYWLIAIFIIAVIHEFAHGIVARAHNIEVKNTGIVLFGPIIGAFVEPNEKKLQKEKDITQYSVLAAGAFSNIALAIIALVAVLFVFTPLQNSMINPVGFTFQSYYNETTPFAQAEIPPGVVITGINDEKTLNFQEFNTRLNKHSPGEEIIVSTTAKEYNITLAQSPDDPNQGFLGISQINNEIAVREPYQAGLGHLGYVVVNWITGLLRWLFLLSLGIGLFNLLPLPIVDGGRMAQVFLHKLKGPIIGEKRYRQISLFFLIVLLLNLFFPLITKVL